MKIFTPNTIISSTDVNSNFDELNSNSSKCINVQNITTNTTVTDQLIQRGWGYITYASEQIKGVTITMPVAFDDTAYDVVAVSKGYKATDPTSRIDVSNIQNNNFGVICNNITSQTFDLYMAFTTNGGTARVLFNWIAIGTKTR